MNTILNEGSSSLPIAQTLEHGASNAKDMDSIPGKARTEIWKKRTMNVMQCKAMQVALNIDWHV